MSRSGFEPTIEETIDCTPRAPAAARRAVERLAPAVDEAVIRDVQLVVSELVTNSVRHSGSAEPIRLRAWARANGLKVEIADGGYGFEPPAEPRAPHEEGGRGLLILQSLAERWGVSRDATTRVWFEIAARPVSASAHAG